MPPSQTQRSQWKTSEPRPTSKRVFFMAPIFRQNRHRFPQGCGHGNRYKQQSQYNRLIPAPGMIGSEGVLTMRRLLLLAAVLAFTCANTGCIMNMYSSDPNERMQTMLNQSENLRQIQKEVDRFWMIDQPSHLTPDRVHGGIGG
jgi:hypothetical protein